MSSKKLNESLIWRKFKEGDTDSFSQIYHTYYKDLYRYGYKILKDPEQTRDYIHNFFLYLWERRENLCNLTSIKFYLIKSFRRHIFRAIEKESKRNLHEESFVQSQPDITFSHEEVIIQKEHDTHLQTYLSSLLNELSPRQREIIYLRYYAELDYSQIAEILQINYQSVLNSLYRAFKKIAQTTVPPVFTMLPFYMIF